MTLLDETDLLAHALDYASQGLEVFPVDPATKAPLGDLAPHGMKDATTDADTIVHWWTARPDASIGCRIPEGQIALDIDPRHGGLDVWANLLDLYGPLTSKTHFSGRNDGGFHVWLDAPDGKLSIKPLNDWAAERGLGHVISDTKTVCGIDILHHGHRYSILPPSPHAETGQPYTWANQGAVAACPEWLAPLIIAPERAPQPTPLPAPRGTSMEFNGDSIADWYTDTQRWTDLLTRHGWTLVAGDGDSDGSKWRHPNATAVTSASITNGNLFIYTPNTPFTETGQGDPNGYTLFRAFGVLEHRGDLSEAARAAALLRGGPHGAPAPAMTIVAGSLGADGVYEPEQTYDALEPWLVDWGEFWETDHKAEDFLCEPILARGRGHALFAKAKTGKSLLTLEMAAALATGRPFLAHPGGAPIHVLYVDYEMTPDDLFDRLETFGYGPGDDLSHLHYAQMPSIAALDTPEGGTALVSSALANAVELVVVDTTARSVQGEENAMETFRDAYRYTFMPLKAAGITTLRVDHAGKDAERGQRGSSAKNDDVDIVWELSAGPRLENGDEQLTLKATHKRMGWIPDSVDLKRSDDAVPMHDYTQERGYIEGTAELAAQLDDAGVPFNAGRKVARDIYGISASNRGYGDAKRYRFERFKTLRIGSQGAPGHPVLDPSTAKTGTTGDTSQNPWSEAGTPPRTPQDTPPADSGDTPLSLRERGWPPGADSTANDVHTFDDEEDDEGLI